MANTNMQDPRSSQARSAWIAGLTEACAKITSVLNMGTASFTDLPLIEERPAEDDKHRIYVAPLGNKLWLSTPAPIIKLDGNVITEQSYEFSIDYLGGSIVFEGEYRPADGASITATATYITGDSKTVQEVNDKLVELDNKAAKNYKGYYETAADLETDDVTGVKGDYVIVESTNEIYVWNEKAGKYVSTYKAPDLSDYYTKGQTNDLLSYKENNITPHGDTTASDAFYYGGRKSWVDLYSMVLGTALKGIVFTDDSTILETDTVVRALGKLQAQITAKMHDIVGTSDPTDATVGLVGQDYINSSNGNKFHLTTITDDGKYVWEKYANNSNVITIAGGATATVSGDFGDPPYSIEFSKDTTTKVDSFNGRTGAVTPQNNDYTAEMVGAVPTIRTVNGKALNTNITLTPEDISAVPADRTVNGKSLYSNITLSASDVNAVPTTRTVNGTPLSGNITLFTYGTSDLEAGSSTLATGQIYLFYE